MNNPIISIIVIVLSLSFGFFYSKPQYEQSQKESANLEKLAITLKSTDTIKNLIDQTGDSLNSVKPGERDRFNVFLPETIDEIRFANNLQSMGFKEGLVLADIKVQEKEKKTKSVVSQPVKSASVQPGKPVSLTAVPVSDSTTEKAVSMFKATTATFTFITTYEKFKLFLNTIEKSLGIVNVNSLSFKEYNEGSENSIVVKYGPTVYQFTVEIETYSLK